MATELGKAYVQIIASADGLGGDIRSSIVGEAGAAGTEGGKTLGSNLAGTVKSIIIAAGIGKVFKDAIMEGAALEQSLGGVEAIFGDAADTVKKNAQAAFKTAGVSANEYMEGVTSFAASLLQSTAGDTQKAADVADRAFRDMSDNANRFGTDMGSIQAAYQGFAKQNYTMLDNLKLGYGGTKTEMERLLKDAQKLSGVEYNIENLADVYTAIGVIQDKLNVTGTTALEAGETFSGSMGMMRAAAKNLLGSLALGENVGPALKDLLSSIMAFAKNAMRLIGNIVMSLPELIFEAVPEITATLLETLKSVTGRSNIGEFISAGADLLKGLVDGIISALPDLIAGVAELMTEFMLNETAPKLFDAGIDLIFSLVDGISENLPMITKAGIELIVKLVVGLIEAIPKIIAAIPKILKSIAEVFINFDWIGLGKSIIEGIVAGIKALGSAIWNALKSIVSNAWQGVKNFLGIGSPSKVFADQIGRWIPAGIAAGIEDNAQTVTDALDDVASMATGTITSDVALATSAQAMQLSAATPAATEGRDLEAMLLTIIELIRAGKVLNINGTEMAAALAYDMDAALGTVAVRKERG